jgi:hypothetical protein
VQRSYFAQKGGTVSKEGDKAIVRAGNMSASTYMCEEGTGGL